MNKGKIIVIEGSSDGIGKSTQLGLLKEHLIKEGYEVVNHHFPSYHTYHGVPVEKYLQGEYGKVSELSPYFINSLYAQDRAITWKTELEPLYNKGKIILLDRYTTSSLIYQSAVIEDIEERKAFIDYATDFEYNKLGIQKPDKVIFLTAPFDLVQSMRRARQNNDGVQNDIHERDTAFLKKVYDNALFVADYLSFDIVECSTNDKMESPSEIHNKVYRLVK